MAEPLQINRSVYGQYGLANIEGYEVPYLNASIAEQLAQPGEKWSNASHSRGNYLTNLGWSGNSFSNALSRGASAFGVEKNPIQYSTEYETGRYYDFPGGLSGTPIDPQSYQFTNLDQIAEKFGIDRSQFKPYEKEVKGYDRDGNFGTIYVQYNADPYIEQRPLTRTVSVEEQMYDKLNDATKDYYSYTGDTLVPGQAGEGSPNSFQTVLYKKEGDVLKPLTTPVSHGGWQNSDVYTGGGGFKLSELIKGIAPVAALAIGGPLLDTLLTGATAASAASSAGGTGLTGGAGGSTGLLVGGSAGGGLTIPTGAAIAVDPLIATGAGAGLGGGMATGGYLSSVGQLSAALPAQGSVGGAGAGLSAELAPGTILGSGAPGGGAIGASYALGANGLPATGLLGQPISASSVGFGGVPETVAPTLSITPNQAIQGLKMASSLLSGGQQQQPQQAAQMPRQNIMPRGQGVDYSGIYNLLALQRARNPNSLLG